MTSELRQQTLRLNIVLSFLLINQSQHMVVSKNARFYVLADFSFRSQSNYDGDTLLYRETQGNTGSGLTVWFTTPSKANQNQTLCKNKMNQTQ